jgi:hypothetical protein
MVDDNGDYLLHEAGHYVVFVFLDGVGHWFLNLGG